MVLVGVGVAKTGKAGRESPAATIPPKKTRRFMVHSLEHLGQTHGAGVNTGLGLRLRHLAQRNRLPAIAVLGRHRLPVLVMVFMSQSKRWDRWRRGRINGCRGRGWLCRGWLCDYSGRSRCGRLCSHSGTHTCRFSPISMWHQSRPVFDIRRRLHPITTKTKTPTSTDVVWGRSNGHWDGFLRIPSSPLRIRHSSNTNQ